MRNQCTYFCISDTQKNKELARILLGCAYISPHLQSWGVNLVELVEVTVDNRVLGQTILRASGHHNCSRNLFSCCSLVIDLLGEGEKKKEGKKKKRKPDFCQTDFQISCTLSSIQTELQHATETTQSDI